MGAWGPGLYSDDVTEDVRGIYVDKLHRGKNGEQASKEMIAEFEWAWSDEDDAPVFWFCNGRYAVELWAITGRSQKEGIVLS